MLAQMRGMLSGMNHPFHHHPRYCPHYTIDSNSIELMLEHTVVGAVLFSQDSEIVDCKRHFVYRSGQ